MRQQIAAPTTFCVTGIESAHVKMNCKKAAQLTVAHRDIKIVRDCYASLRELVIHNPGGWDDAASLDRAEELCRAAIAALPDDECHARLRSVQAQAGALYSRDAHLKWVRPSMSGADYLRLQMLIALEALNTRLFFIAAQRDRGSLSALEDEEVPFPSK
jgi:hypothetical protein